MKNNKQLLKIIIPVAIVLIIALGGTIAYKIMKPTPEKTLEKYCNYLADKDYEKAYEMLYNTDNDFMSEDIFQASLENVDFAQYTISSYNKSDFTSSDIETNGTTYEVQASGNKYAIEISENGNKGIFKNYKINANNLAKTWEFSEPKGTEIYINDKQVTKITGTKYKSGVKDDVYNPEVDTYSTNNIFQGNYNVTFKLDGTESIVENNVQVGKGLSEDFEVTQELSDQLQKQTKEFLTDYYNNSDISNLLTSDSKINDELKEWQIEHSSKSETLNNDVTIESVRIEDSTHATVRVKYSVNTTVYGPVINYDIETPVEFKKENDKWLVCDFYRN